MARSLCRRWGKRCGVPAGVRGDATAANWHTLTLLHYLDLADGTPLCGRMIPFSQYKDGLVRGGGLDRNAELIVRRDLSVLPPEELERRCEALGANFEASNADLCARFDFAPRYPVWLKVWFGDEEFPASGHLFVDASAPRYLTIEDAVTVGGTDLGRPDRSGTLDRMKTEFEWRMRRWG